MEFPKDLKYTKDHEWARIQNNIATVGITAHAQSSLGDIVHVELPPVGKVLKVGDSFGVVESVKAVSDLYAPMSGKVTEVNPKLSSDPVALNQHPYTEGWIIKLELSEPSQVSTLIDAPSYETLVKSLS
jgi:glycine cleavage system H protein